MQPFEAFREAYAAGLNNLRGRKTEFTGDNIFGGSTVSGVSVTKDTVQGLSAFWGCVRYISSGIAPMPWGVFASVNGGREEQRNHRVWSTLRDQPIAGMTPNVWRSTMLWNALVTGNGLSEITREGLKFIDEPVTFVKLEDGSLAYQVMSSQRIILGADMFHLKGPSWDGWVGQSVVQVAAENLGFGLASQQYGSSFFGAGTHVGGIYTTERDMQPDQIENLRQTIDESKGPGRAHRPRILTRGMTYIPDTIPPQDAQWLEGRKFHAREITMWFGVPAHKLNIEEGATAFASREQANIEAVVDALMPWVVRLEQEANLKLLTTRERSSGVFTHINMDAQLRGDTKTRTEGYKTLIRNGVMTVNEARSKEEMSALDEGAKPLISRDMMFLDQVGDLADSQIEGNTQAQAFAPLVADAIDCIKIRAKQNKTRGRPPDEIRAFARLKLEPLEAAHKHIGLPFDLDNLIDEGVKDELV